MPINLDSVKSILIRNIEKVHTIDDIARLVNASPETLRKDFVRLEKVPLSTFITIARVEVAKGLLSKSAFSCKDICYKVGFSREDVGAKAFKRLTGKTMGDFRKLPNAVKSSALESDDDQKW